MEPAELGEEVKLVLRARKRGAHTHSGSDRISGGGDGNGSANERGVGAKKGSALPQRCAAAARLRCDVEDVHDEEGGEAHREGHNHHEAEVLLWYCVVVLCASVESLCRPDTSEEGERVGGCGYGRVARTRTPQTGSTWCPRWSSAAQSNTICAFEQREAFEDGSAGEEPGRIRYWAVGSRVSRPTAWIDQFTLPGPSRWKGARGRRVLRRMRRAWRDARVEGRG